jgi:hypothetical protein
MRLVREHLEICAICASEHRFESGVLRSIRDKLWRLAVAADLRARTSARIAADSAGGRSM